MLKALTCSTSYSLPFICMCPALTLVELKPHAMLSEASKLCLL